MNLGFIYQGEIAITANPRLLGAYSATQQHNVFNAKQDFTSIHRRIYVTHAMKKDANFALKVIQENA